MFSGSQNIVTSGTETRVNVFMRNHLWWGMRKPRLRWQPADQQESGEDNHHKDAHRAHCKYAYSAKSKDAYRAKTMVEVSRRKVALERKFSG